MAEEAQPPEGQGDQSAGGLYDSYLQFVPPEQQDAARAHLAEVSKSVNGRLEEAANLRSTYEPIANLGYTPEDIGMLINWHQEVYSNPESLQEWLATAAREFGLDVSAGAAPEPAGEPDEYQRLSDQIAPLQQRMDELANQQFLTNEAALIEQRFTQLEEEQGLKLTNEQRDVIVQLGISQMPEDGQSLVAGQDWIQAGWDAFKDVYAQAQTAFVNDLAEAPPPVLESGGAAQAQLPRTWEEGRASAAERLRQARA